MNTFHILARARLRGAIGSFQVIDTKVLADSIYTVESAVKDKYETNMLCIINLTQGS